MMVNQIDDGGPARDMTVRIEHAQAFMAAIISSPDYMKKAYEATGEIDGSTTGGLVTKWALDYADILISRTAERAEEETKAEPAKSDVWAKIVKECVPLLQRMGREASDVNNHRANVTEKTLAYWVTTDGAKAGLILADIEQITGDK